MTEFVFFALAAFAAISAVMCITQKNIVASALWLVSTMFALAGIYVLLYAQFIAAIQILVYAGAVMVLFLFVIMLLNLGREKSDLRAVPVRTLGAVMAASLVLALIGVRTITPGFLASQIPGALGKASPLDVFPGGREVTAAAAFANPVGAVARPLFETYLVPFELTSILLLAAAVGAVVLAKKKI
jgi:NADH-quinone oxidoreductase subunit J